LDGVGSCLTLPVGAARFSSLFTGSIGGGGCGWYFPKEYSLLSLLTNLYNERERERERDRG
jgi:hypothetical protein